MPANHDLRFLDAFLPEARRRIEAAGAGWLERWQALALQIEQDDEEVGGWAAVKATQILGAQIAAGRLWDGTRWVSPEAHRAMYGRQLWEVEMEQLALGQVVIDEGPVIEAFIRELRAGRWGGMVALGYQVTEGTKHADLEKLLAVEAQIQAGVYPEWASDEEVEESIASLGPGWTAMLHDGEEGVLEAGRALAAVASRARVKKLERRE